MWVIIFFCAIFSYDYYSMCWSKFFMKTYAKTQGLGLTLLPPSFPPTLIRLFGVVDGQDELIHGHSKPR